MGSQRDADFYFLLDFFRIQLHLQFIHSSSMSLLSMTIESFFYVFFQVVLTLKYIKIIYIFLKNIFDVNKLK